MGLGAASSLLAACGEPLVAPEVVALFSSDRVLAAGQTQRVPIAIVSPTSNGGDGANVALPADDGTIEILVLKDGEEVDRVEVDGHVVEHDHVGDVDPDHQHADLFRYYPARLLLPEPGVYDLEIILGTDGAFSRQPNATLPVQAFAPDEVTVPRAGQVMPSVATPTFDDPAGVDRICTRFEPCPFHEVSLDSVLGQRPVALLVATPAFCSTAYCGPVVDTLIGVAPTAPDVRVIHAEVYANTDEVGGNLADPNLRIAPAVEAIGLAFEPSLFLIDSGGTIVDRIDNVFDATEAADALAALR